MLSLCCDLDDDACPISDDALAKLYSANNGSLPGLLDTVEPEVKPALAFFCYRRAHLQTVGLAIAASCDESELVAIGGRAGAVLFARSREERVFLQTRPTYPVKKKITPPPGFLCIQTFDQETE